MLDIIATFFFLFFLGWGGRGGGGLDHLWHLLGLKSQMTIGQKSREMFDHLWHLLGWKSWLIIGQHFLYGRFEKENNLLSGEGGLSFWRTFWDQNNTSLSVKNRKNTQYYSSVLRRTNDFRSEGSSMLASENEFIISTMGWNNNMDDTKMNPIREHSPLGDKSFSGVQKSNESLKLDTKFSHR